MYSRFSSHVGSNTFFKYIFQQFILFDSKRMGIWTSLPFMVLFSSINWASCHKIHSITGDLNTAHMFCCKNLGSQHIRNECGHMCQTYPCTQWWLSGPSAWPHFLQAPNENCAFKEIGKSSISQFYKPWTGEGSPSKLMLNPWAESKI